MRNNPESIYEAEESLFRRWEKNRSRFVRDGVISEVDYSESKHKIVFILKEVNDPDPDGGGWDLREFVLDGGRPQTWDNVARWVHGIRNLPAISNWDSYSDIKEDFRREVLKDICVVNLKKSPGPHTTVSRNLKSAAMEDSEYLKEQYSIYDPDLTICGGTSTAALFKRVVEHDKYKWQSTSRGIRWYQIDKSKVVISFAHPEARVQDSILLYCLLDAINEICA